MMRKPLDIKIGDKTLADILKEHALWLASESGGVRANLYGANLVRANLVRANLYGANLVRANLDGANLDGANLYGANLVRANLDGANLYGANLVRANLDGAILDGANLDGSVGNGSEVRSLQFGGPDGIAGWPVTYTAELMQIGCQRHTIDEWREFSDGQISAMDGDALAWWRVAKPIIFATIEAFPATPIVRAEKTEVA